MVPAGGLLGRLGRTGENWAGDSSSASTGNIQPSSPLCHYPPLILGICWVFWRFCFFFKQKSKTFKEEIQNLKFVGLDSQAFCDKNFVWSQPPPSLPSSAYTYMFMSEFLGCALASKLVCFECIYIKYSSLSNIWMMYDS